MTTRPGPEGFDVGITFHADAAGARDTAGTIEALVRQLGGRTTQPLTYVSAGQGPVLVVDVKGLEPLTSRV